MRHFRECHHVPECLGLLLGVSLYSYQVRELMVCWSFLVLLFMALLLLIVGGVIAWHGANAAKRWANARPPVIPGLALDAAAEVQVKAVPDGTKLK